MAERDKGHGRDIRFPLMDQAALDRERARKLRTLQRLGDALGRPVEDFYENGAERSPAQGKVDGAGRE